MGRLGGLGPLAGASGAIRHPLTRFLLLLVALYGALAAPWPGLAAAYAAGYRAAAEALFGSFGSGGIVRFEPASGGTAGDTTIALGRRGSPVVARVDHDARVTGYLPTIETLSFVLATPLVRRRRLAAALAAFAAVHAFLALRLAIVLLHFFSGDGAWCLFALPAPAERLLAWLHELAVVSPTATFVVPALIWAATTLPLGMLEVLGLVPAGAGEVRPPLSARSSARRRRQ